MYPKNELEMIATVRRPIQCEGIERGRERIAEVAINGAVNPQINWGSLFGNVASHIPDVLSWF